jgi:TM2 domain-containing membrane protein YozV
MKHGYVFRALSCLGFVGLAGGQWFYLGRPGRGLAYLLTLGYLGVGTVKSVANAYQLVSDDARRREAAGFGPAMATAKQRSYIIDMADRVGREHAQAALGPSFWLTGVEPWTGDEPLDRALDRLTKDAATLAIESLMARSASPGGW